MHGHSNKSTYTYNQRYRIVKRKTCEKGNNNMGYMVYINEKEMAQRVKDTFDRCGFFMDSFPSFMDACADFIRERFNEDREQPVCFYMGEDGTATAETSILTNELYGYYTGFVSGNTTYAPIPVSDEAQTPLDVALEVMEYLHDEENVDYIFQNLDIVD